MDFVDIPFYEQMVDLGDASNPWRFSSLVVSYLCMYEFKTNITRCFRVMLLFQLCMLYKKDIL